MESKEGSFFYDSFAVPVPNDIDPNNFLADADEAMVMFDNADMVVASPSDRSGKVASVAMPVAMGRGSPHTSLGDSSSVSSMECSRNQTQERSSSTSVSELKRRKLQSGDAQAVKTESDQGSSVDGNDSPVALGVDVVHELLKEQEIKKQRLARKAELARMSRKRKKTRMCDLEQEVDQLKAELEKERKARKSAQHRAALAEKKTEEQSARLLQLSEEAVRTESKKLHNALRAIPSMSSDDAKEQHAQAIIGELIKLFSKRDSRMWDQMGQMKAVLGPALPFRFLDWAMTQQDKFYQDPSGLWASLFQKEVGLSSEQLQQVMELRAGMQSSDAKTFRMIEERYEALTSELDTYLKQSNSTMQQLTDILTAEQLAKFFAWVDTYGEVCIKINV